jgi:hypothetical protein
MKIKSGGVIWRGSRGAEVKWLKESLNALVRPSPALTIDPVASRNQFDKETEDAVRWFQFQNDIRPADGVVGAHTQSAIWKGIAPSAWIRNTTITGSALRFDRTLFFEHYIAQFGISSSDTVPSLGRLLSFIEWDPDVNDVRWAAYMLATVRFECGPDFLPIEEGGCDEKRFIKDRVNVCTTLPDGNTRDYGNPIACPMAKPPSTCPNGKTQHCYFGRGYVQITGTVKGPGNYETMSGELGLGTRLVHFPEDVLKPEIAYQIMSIGMRKGLFRPPNNLEKWIKPANLILGRWVQSDSKPDYTNARSIINGKKKKTDQFADNAVSIAHFAEQMESILAVSLVDAPKPDWRSIQVP